MKKIVAQILIMVVLVISIPIALFRIEVGSTLPFVFLTILAIAILLSEASK